ncbi:MAG: hypothetical protein LBB07_00865 [Bifidobacteriaceae bacterium]|jgi:hypothetical protein|nr:hypothetical protein [Bifidobacteriaceae bacterium]
MNPKRIGIVLSAIIFCIMGFISGVNFQMVVNSATSTSILPVAKGGTGQTNLANVMGIGSANKLATARTINGVSFDGTQNISIPGYYKKLDVNIINGQDFIYLKAYIQESADNIMYVSNTLTMNGASVGADPFLFKFSVKEGINNPDEKTLQICGNTDNSYLPVINRVRYYISGYNYYFKIKNFSRTTRPFWYQTSSPYLVVQQVTDSDTLATLNSSRFYLFDQAPCNAIVPEPTS